MGCLTVSVRCTAEVVGAVAAIVAVVVFFCSRKLGRGEDRCDFARRPTVCLDKDTSKRPKSVLLIKSRFFDDSGLVLDEYERPRNEMQDKFDDRVVSTAKLPIHVSFLCFQHRRESRRLNATICRMFLLILKADLLFKVMNCRQ